MNRIIEKENAGKSQKTTVAIAMSAILITTSAVTLPMLLSKPECEFSFVNDLLYFVGLGAIIASSLLIDSVLDDLKINFSERLNIFGGGYLVFSILIALLSVTTISLFSLSQLEGKTDILNWKVFVIWGLTGMSVLLKLMTETDYNIFTWGIVVGVFISYSTIVLPNLFNACGLSIISIVIIPFGIYYRRRIH